MLMMNKSTNAIALEQWESKTLGDIVERIVGGGTPSRNNKSFWGKTIPWATVKDFATFNPYQTQECITLVGLRNSSSNLIPSGTLITSTRMALGKAVVYEVDVAINQDLKALFLKNSVNVKYLTQWFKFFGTEIDALGSGSTVKGISLTELRGLPFQAPPLSEQTTIADTLTDVDALLDSLDRIIAKKRDLKQAAMQQLLTGQTRLPGFSGKWEVKRLGDVATFYKGKGLPKSSLTYDGVDPCIHYGELFTHYAEAVGEITSRTNGAKDSFRSIANDVLMPTSDVTPSGLAKASCVNVDGIILGGDILVIRSNRILVLGAFLSYVIRREEDQVLRLVSGSTVYHLYGSDMKKFKFWLPSLSEQTAIATVLADMDNELKTLESRLAKTRKLKQGMMHELLTGRTRLV